MEVDGLHQVKDMDQATAAGHAVRQYVMLKSTEFVMRANDTRPTAPRLAREEGAMGESSENALTTMVREAASKHGERDDR